VRDVPTRGRTWKAGPSPDFTPADVDELTRLLNLIRDNFT
jgi:hypothetical protein